VIFLSEEKTAPKKGHRNPLRNTLSSIIQKYPTMSRAVVLIFTKKMNFFAKKFRILAI